MRSFILSSPEAQSATPYWTALQEEAARLLHRLQAPGHGGKLPSEFTALLGEQFAGFDVSVVTGLDVPRPGHPAPLTLAEDLAAEAVGAQACSFFTNGASMAAFSLASALVDVAKGRRIIVARNAHISVINTMFERGANVTFLPVEVHPELGMATVLDPAKLKAALAAGDVGGVWISTPNYEGVLGNTAECIRACKRAGVPVVVDGSWASEMPFSQLMGPSPIQLGADAEVGSPHKTLRAPGQAAWAFLGKDSLIPLEVFEVATLRHKTTSKSSVLLAALDLCRRWSYLKTDEGIEQNQQAVAEHSRLLPAGMLVDWDQERRAGQTIAPSSISYRMTFRTWETGYTGYELATALREQHGVQVAQPNLLYMFMGTGVGRPDVIQASFTAIRSLLDDLPSRPALDRARLPLLELSEADVEFGQAHGDTETVPLADAVGRRLAHPIGAYPPGLAILTPGERLDSSTVGFLTAVRAQGGTLYGGSPRLLKDGLVTVLR